MKMIPGLSILALLVNAICPSFSEDHHGLKNKDQEMTSINPATNDSFQPWKATEGSPLWKVMHAKVKESFWTQGYLHSLMKPRSDAADLLNAKTVAIITFGPSRSQFFTWWGKPYFHPDGANVIRDREILETEIIRWNQYTLVKDPTSADLVIALREWDHEDCPGFCMEGITAWAGSRLIVFKGGAEFEEKAEALWGKQKDSVRNDAYQYAAMLICDLRETIEKLGKRKGGLHSDSRGRCSVDTYRDALPYWELPEGNPLRDRMYEPSFSEIEPDALSFRKIPLQDSELLRAATVAIILFGRGHSLSCKNCGASTPNVLTARETVENELKKATHYKIVEDPRTADLVMAIRVWTHEQHPILFGNSKFYDMARLALFKGGINFDQAPKILWADESGGDLYGMIHLFCKDINTFQKAAQSDK
jgi:hypothetical protein